MAAKITMTGIDKLADSIRAHDRRVKRVVAGQFEFGKSEAVTFAKLNAPWTDRTAAARNGLFAETNYGPEQGFYAELTLAHTVYYGIFLEARNSGRFAIIMPTILHIGNLMMDRIASSIARMELQS